MNIYKRKVKLTDFSSGKAESFYRITIDNGYDGITLSTEKDEQRANAEALKRLKKLQSQIYNKKNFRKE